MRNNRFDNPRQSDRGESMVPVSEGEELDVKIEAVGEKGDGIAKKNGFVIFVPGVSQGDNVRIKITKVLRKMAFAEKIGEAKPSQEKSTEEEAKEIAEEMTEEDSDEGSYQDSENFGE